jgi:ribosome-binding protein aMBF1 (putative translation factor)
MLKKYEQIIDGYKVWHPSLFSQTVECRPSGHHSILASLNDGSKIEYDSRDNTIRDVTKYYDHENNDNVDEITWRKEFGRKLQRAIQDKGISQETLSEITGLSRQMISRYIRGNSTPSGYVVSRLAEALDCDVRELTKFGYIDE